MTKEELKKEAQEQVNYCTPLYPESFIQGYLAGAEPRENKIAEIKANCDLAIEGRDIKIKELELELTVEKDQHQEEINLHLHAEEYIKSLEKENAELKEQHKVDLIQIQAILNQRSIQNKKLIKAKDLLQRFIKWARTENCEKFDVILEQAEQFLKDVPETLKQGTR